MVLLVGAVAVIVLKAPSIKSTLGLSEPTTPQVALVSPTAATSEPDRTLEPMPLLPTDTPVLPTPARTPIPPTPTRAAPTAGATWVRERDEMLMVYVPAREFTMGSDDNDLDYALELCNQYYGDCERDWWEDEQPPHNVLLDGFWLDRTEVSNGQYQRCVEAGACDPPAENDPDYGNSAYDNYPVIYVAWPQAMAYCEWTGARLPTEAEWEYAARGPEGRLFPWGDTFDGGRLNYCDANCQGDHPDKTVNDGYADTAPVGSYPDGASWCGALDMAGNVWELVADWYDRYLSSPVRNPQGPELGDYRVVRGGSWNDAPDSALSANRYGTPPDGWNYSVGFRCARDSE